MGFYLSEADTKSNPMKAVPTVQKMMYNWKSHDLWTQMSPDPFFSTVLLRSLHPSALLRHDDLLLQETQRFLRQQSLSPATSSSDKNPLFTFAATYLQTIQDSRKKFVSNSNLNKPPTNPSPQTPGADSGRYKPRGLELAAAACTAPAAASSPPASSAPSTTGPNLYQHEGKPIFIRAICAPPGPVIRTADVYFQHNANGNPKRYLAVATVHDICASQLPLQQLSPVNLRARLASAPAVTTTFITVLGACKCTRPQGCSFRITLLLQGCSRTDFRQFSNLLPHMTTNIQTLI